MVDCFTQPTKGCSDSTIAVTPLVAGIDAGNLLLQASVFIFGLGYLLLIVKGAARDAGQLQQPGQWIVLP